MSSGDIGYHPFWQRTGPNDLNSKIMLTAVISLVVVILIVIILHIYARRVLRRQAQRRARTGQLGNTQAEINAGEPPKTGLDPSIIASLPIFVFKQADPNKEKDNTTMECAICLSMLREAEMARLLPNCHHTFHAGCIDKWLSSHSTCPICRSEAEPKVQAEAEMAANGVRPTSAPLEHANPSTMSSEGTSDGAVQSSLKVDGSGSRLSSFRRMLSKERLGTEDLERQ